MVKKMESYYFCAQIKINDEEEYRKYISGSEEVFKKFNGRYLAVDDKSEILEGNWNYSRSVIIKFKSKEDFRAWYYSDEYQEILKYRLSASVCDTILIRGLNQNEEEEYIKSRSCTDLADMAE
jgi:uncharacterized protein (DUF1330 family)